MSRIRTLVAGAAVAAAVVLGTALPASAHDELVSSTPAAGEVLTVAPASVTLSFSADVMAVGAEAAVVDASGADWIAGTPEITMTDVTIALKEGMPAGSYEFRWRVVSSDGHPISGLIPFTIEGAAEPTPDASAEPTPDASAEPTPVATVAPVTDDAQPTSEDSGLARTIAIAAGGAVVALLLFLGIPYLRRRRSAAGDTNAEKQ